MPDAWPLLATGTSASTTPVSCAVARPTPSPYTNSGGTVAHHAVAGPTTTPIPATPTISRTMPSRTVNTGPFFLASWAPKPLAAKLPMARGSSAIPVRNAL